MENFKQVGFIELATHNEVLRSYVLTMLHLSNFIKIFTIKQNFDQLYDLKNHPKIQWFITESQSTSVDFIKNHTDDLRSCSQLIVITLPNHSKFFLSHKFPAKTWLVIHNYHTYFNIEPSFHSEGTFWDKIKQYIKILKHRFDLDYKQVVSNYTQYDNIILPSEFILNNSQNKAHVPYYPNPIVFDFTIYENIIFKKIDGQIKIVIPGTPSQNTRDIHVVWKAFKNIVPTLKKPIELIFLGRLKGKRNITNILKFKKLENEFFRLQYFQSFIPQLEFDKHLMDADFLILPLKRSMHHGVYIENFGQTTVSGSISDMIKYGIPSIVPDFYPLEKTIEPLVKRYSDETSLLNGIVHMIDADLHSIKNKAMPGLMENTSVKKSQKLLNQHNLK